VSYLAPLFTNPPLTSRLVRCDFAMTSTAYMYRMCLEYARLWADDREAMNFSP